MSDLQKRIEMLEKEIELLKMKIELMSKSNGPNYVPYPIYPANPHYCGICGSMNCNTMHITYNRYQT